MVEVVKTIVTSFKRSHARTTALSAPMLQQATSDPLLCQRLLDSHRQVWFSLLWGHCSFLLGPGVHKVLFVPSKCLFPQSCVSSVIKSHSPPKSNSLGVLSHLPDPQVGKSVVGPRTFLRAQDFIWYHCSALCVLLCGSMVGLMATSSKRASATWRWLYLYCSTQSPCPCDRPLLTHTFSGDTQILRGNSGSVSMGFSWCAQGFV